MGTAVRELTRGFYARLRETLPGKVIFGMMGSNALGVLGSSYRGYRISLNFGDYSTQVLSPTHVRIRFSGYPSDCVDASDTGVILGALDTCGEKGQVRIARIDDMNAELDAQW